MRTIFRIARLEWGIWLYSPIAWLISVVFVIETTYHFWDTIGHYFYWRQLGETVKNMTERLYPAPWHFFAEEERFLSVFMPLLTMGLMSRELSSGSIRLLMSSPVRSVEIVLGKYLAVLSYGLLMVLLVGILGLQAHFMIKEHDDGLFMAGLTGMFLLISAYSAIGLYMSSLTPHQLVAAVCGIALLTVLRAIGGLWQNVPFLRDLTFFLSIAGRNSEMTHGLIGSKDIAYFSIVVLLFLGLMYLYLEGRRDTRHWAIKAGRVLLYVCVLLGAGYISSRPRLARYWDLTANHSMTLTPASQEVTKRVSGRLQIHVYANILDDDHGLGMPYSELYNIGMFSQYQRSIPYVDLDFTRYYDTCFHTQLYKDHPGQSSRDLAMMVKELDEYDGVLLSPSAMRRRVDLSAERYRMIWQLEMGGKRTNLRVYDDIPHLPMEAQISAGLKRLTDGVQTICFVTGHGERNLQREGDDDYGLSVSGRQFRFSLINDGFDVVTVDLRISPPPPQTSILVVADPMVGFTPAERERVERWTAGGGNLLIAGEPGRSKIVNELTDSLGVRLRDTALTQVSRERGADYILGRVRGMPELPLEMPGVAALLIDSRKGFRVDTLVEADGQPLIVELHRSIGKREQRIVVSGDADFMRNAAVTKFNPTMPGKAIANYAVMAQLFGWLSYGQFPLDDSRPEIHDDELRISAGQLAFQRVLWQWGLPGLLFLTGAVVLIRRRRQ